VKMPFQDRRWRVLLFLSLGAAVLAWLATTPSAFVTTPGVILAAQGAAGGARGQRGAGNRGAAPPRHATAPDREKTSAGELTITPINHASLMLEFGGKVIQVDPVGDYSQLPKADLILITDIHGDHMAPNTVAELKKTGTIVVAPSAVAKTITEARTMDNGQSDKISLQGTSIPIEAVPMYNLTRGPAAGQFYHTKGRGNGYVLTFGDKRVYIAGDTECTPEMKALKNIDIAFLPMNLPYTMTPQEAADCVKAFRPKIVYPYHYMGQDPKVFADALKNEKGIEVRLREWY
jgi:L-ascorbate metabolism protein UlaG (beta-lactamase superfamily)